jgi:hypothetical protein
MNQTMHFSVSHWMQGVAATGAILAAEIPHSVELTDWVQMVERLGLAVALVIFFVVTGWKREQRMAKRLDWLEKENDKLSTRTAILAEQVNQSLLQSTKLVGDALGVLEGRMCWACRTREEFEAMQRQIEKKAP